MMPDLKSTQGPWRFKGDEYSGSVWAPDGRVIATIPRNSKRPQEEKRANGQLIEKAPVLRDFCTALLEFWEEQDCTISDYAGMSQGEWLDWTKRNRDQLRERLVTMLGDLGVL